MSVPREIMEVLLLAAGGMGGVSVGGGGGGGSNDELTNWHGKEDYHEVRIYPDGTCIKKWKYDSDSSWGTAEGMLKKPYEELVRLLEDGDVITQYLDWSDDNLPF